MENQNEVQSQVMDSNGIEMTKPTSWEKIKQLILRYHAKMNDISNCLIAESPTLRVDKDYEVLNFHIDKAALSRIDVITKLPGFDKLLVFFGTDEDAEMKDSNTIIILGADSKGKVLSAHKNDNPKGEETWPDEDGVFILRSTRDELEDFLS